MATVNTTTTIALASKPCYHGTTDTTLLKKTTRRLGATSHATVMSLATTETGSRWTHHHDTANTIQGRNHRNEQGPAIS
jgi:hypothetical protein